MRLCENTVWRLIWDWFLGAPPPPILHWISSEKATKMYRNLQWEILSIFLAFSQYLNFTSDKVTYSFRRIERRWTVQPTWPPCTMDYDHVKSLAKYYKTFFLQSCTRKLQILLTRESTILSFLSFSSSCPFKIRSVYIRTIYADEKNVLLCILAF